MFNFAATIYKEGMNYAVQLPEDCKVHFRYKEYVPVRGTIDDEDFKGTLIPRRNGKYVLFLNRDTRKKIKKSEFDKVKVSLEYDPESRDLPVPEDVELLLSENAGTYEAFLQLSKAQRREIIHFIIDVKKAETRLSRIQKVEQILRQRLMKKTK